MNRLTEAVENCSSDDLLPRQTLGGGQRVERSFEFLIGANGECHDRNDTVLIPQRCADFGRMAEWGALSVTAWPTIRDRMTSRGRLRDGSRSTT